MDFKGVIIAESLKDRSVLKDLTIRKTTIEKVTLKHRTPWLKQWTIYSVEINEEKIDEIAEKIRNSLETEHDWYIELKNNKYEITIFQDNIIKKRVFNYFK